MSFFMGGLAVLMLAACGGRVEGAAGGETSSFPSSAVAEQTPDSAPGPVDGAWGTWQLLSVEGSDGKRIYDPPFIEIDLHPDGTAYRWTCAAGPTGSGLRCPVGLRQGCLAGTIALDGFRWRVRLNDRTGTNVAGGEIEEEASGDIRVDGNGALSPGAHYRRVAAASKESCSP